MVGLGLSWGGVLVGFCTLWSAVWLVGLRGLCMTGSEIEMRRKQREKISVTLGIMSPSMLASEREKMPRMAMASHETLKAKAVRIMEKFLRNPLLFLYAFCIPKPESILSMDISRHY